MATYYKYAEQEADSQINWGEIGKNLSDTLAEANKLREDKKAAIDASTREFSKTLANAPQGENGLANQRTLEYANNATEMMLMQERLLKSGQLKFKDYATVRQNLVDSTEQAFGLAQEYQEEYKKKMERLESGISSGLEQWEMEQLEGYANLSGMNFYIDPTTGNVSMGKVLKKTINGKTVDAMDDNPNNYVTVNTARNRLKSYHDKFKVEESLQEAASMLGTNIESIRKAGGLFKAGEIVTTSDPTKKKDVDGAINLYMEAEKNFISSRLSNDYNVQSVLYDHEKYDPVTGEAYRYSFDPKDQASNVILMKTENGRTVVDREGKFFKDQYAVAEKYMQQQLRIMVDREVKIDTYSEPANFAPNYGNRGGDDFTTQKKEAANMLGYFYYGTPSQIQAATSYFKGVDPSIVGINRANDRIIIERKNADGETSYKSIYMQQGSNRLSQKEFIQAASPELAKINDIFTGLAQGSYAEGKPLSIYQDNQGKGTIIKNRTVTGDENTNKNKVNAAQY